MQVVEKELHLETQVLRVLPTAPLSISTGTVAAFGNSLWQKSPLFFLLKSRWQRGSGHYPADRDMLCLFRLKITLIQ